jgi:hypothetical protein
MLNKDEDEDEGEYTKLRSIACKTPAFVGETEGSSVQYEYDYESLYTR